jgi:carboxylesterase type B
MPLLPVVVYIHGGQFLAGTGRDPLFRGDPLTRADTPVVVVTLNYRLGALGWLGGSQLSGNYGFLDQQLALRWVQSEIAAFGGDPNRVTISGQSAGACSVGMHMVAPSSAHLFQRAVMFSNPLTLMHTVEVAQHYSSTFYRQLNCTDDNLDCLRRKPLLDIVKGGVLPEVYFFPSFS